MHGTWRWIWAAAAAVFLPGPVGADVVQIPADRDNTLYEDGGGNLSNGSGARLFAGRTLSHGARRTLLHFDLNAYLPPGSAITSAVLRLNASLTAGAGQSHPLRRVTQSWGEGASDAGDPGGDGAPSAAGDATWLHTFFNTSLWSSAGGDLSAVTSAITVVSGTGAYTWSSPQLAADVQDMLDNKAGNFGWGLLGNEAAAGTAKRFDSREHSTAANRPTLTVGFVRPAAPPLERITHSARLLPESEVSPVTNDFIGAGLFAYDRSTRTLHVFALHNVTNANAAHIHGPAGAGTNAGIVFTLSNGPIITNAFVLTAAQETALLDGLYYVNVHNADFPGGAIRGQILVRDQFGAALTGAGQVPPATNAFFGIGVFAYDRPTRALDYLVVHDVTNASAAHFHGYVPAGENAGAVVDLGLGSNPLRGVTMLDASLEAALRIGHLYVNVHSPDFPAGAVRGQLGTIGALGAVTHTAQLEPSQEAPPQTNDFSGVGLFSLDRPTGRLEYFIQHNVTNASAAHFHGPAGVGTNAGILIDFGLPTSPISGVALLSPAEVVQVLGGLWYVNVHNTAFPGGAIRGQVLPGHDFATRLAGREETPPVTRAEAGAGVFQYDYTTRELSYRIEHDVRSPTVAHIHGPAVEGVAAPALYFLSGFTSPIAGSVVFGPADELNLLKGRLYVNVHSATDPAGAVRGQILAPEAVPSLALTAALTPDQETPPLTNDFSGTAVLSYHRASRLLSWVIEHNVADMTAAHIHGPAPTGTPAGIVFGLGGPGNPLRGRRVLTAAQEKELLGGRYYINIHNPEFVPGAIRGQIRATDAFGAVLQGRQEEPPRPTAATGAGIFSYHYPSRTLAYRVEHSVAGASAAHIHGPALPGVNAGIVEGFPGPASPIAGAAALTAEEEQDLFNGLYYVNVHSPTYPGGEIRGQLQAIEPIPAYTHSAVLEDAQEEPPVTNGFSGVGLFAYDCGARILKLEIHHSVTNASTAHIHGPAGSGTNAGVVFAFDAPHSPIVECLTLTPAQDLELRAGLWYVNVHNPAFPDGAIRGQLLPAARLHSVLEGRQQENPAPLTTAARGLGLFLFEPATSQLVYHIEHTVEHASVAHIHGPAAAGVGAPPALNTPHVSPITGSTNLTASQIIALFQGLYYVNIHSTNYPPGEIRGQIVPSIPDTDCNGIDDFWEQDRGLAPGGYDASLPFDGGEFSVFEEYIADTDPNSADSFPHVAGLEGGTTNMIFFGTSAFRQYRTERNTNLLDGSWFPMQAAPFQGTGGLIGLPVTNGGQAENYRLLIIKP